MAPDQEHMQGVTVPPNAFSPMFLLSQQQCADMCCCETDRCFQLINLVLNKRLALLSL